jgi:hypothetical protein
MPILAHPAIPAFGPSVRTRADAAALASPPGAEAWRWIED